MKIKINSIKINIKISFFVLTLLMIALRNLEQFFIAYIFMIVHELIHIVISKEYGCKISSINVMPIGLSADIYGLEDISLWQRIIVVISAPIFNIIIGLIFINSYIGLINLCIGVFNLLPIYPLDGSKLMNYIGGYFFGTLRANRYIVNISLFTCYSLIFVGCLQMILMSYNISLLLVAVYIIKESKKYEQNIAYFLFKTLTHKKKNRIMSVKYMAVASKTELKTIVYRLGLDYYTILNIRDKEIKIEITEDMIQDFIEERGIHYNLVDIIDKISYYNT